MGQIEKLTSEEVEDAIRRVCGSFAVDGMILDDEDKDRLRRSLSGEITSEEAIQEIKDKYHSDGYKS